MPSCQRTAHPGLGRREYIGVVAKVGDLRGAVSSSSGLREVMHQVVQCFDNPYEDLFGMTRLTMDRAWVVTTGSIVPGASASIYDSLRKSNLDKLVRFISGSELVDLIDQYYTDYWTEKSESIDVVRERAGRMEKFTRALLRALGGQADDVDETLRSIAESPLNPRVHIGDWSLSSLSPYAANVTPLTGDLPPGYYTDAGELRAVFMEAKKRVYYAMFDVDETIRKYEKVMSLTDPQEFLDAFESDLREVYPFWNAAGAADEANRAIGYLSGAVEQTALMVGRLEAIGKRTWAISLFDSVSDLEPEVAMFLRDVDRDTYTLHWQIETNSDTARLRLLYNIPDAATPDILRTTHRRTLGPKGLFNGRHENAAEVLDHARAAVRDYLESLAEGRRR
jgi:hypothetical protein